MSLRRKITLGTLVLVLLAVSHLGISFLWHIDKERIVARAVSPDGVVMCIVQKCNWDVEPFTTSFVFRKPGRDWGWFYYDHQDWYWKTGRVILDTNSNTARFYRGGKLAVTFHWPSETYTLHSIDRTIQGAQSGMPHGWEPGTSEPCLR